MSPLMRAAMVAPRATGRSPLAPRGYADGGRAQPALSYEAQRFLDALRQADLEASGGGIFTPIPGGRVAGGGVNARAAVPVGRNGAALDFSTGQMGTSASGRGFRSNQSRMTGAGVGYTTPSGGRLSLDYHDRMMADPDTLPGADPIELMDRPAPSRGLRLGYRREFAEGGLAQSRERRTFRDQMRDIEAEIRGERPASMGVTIARGFGEGGGGLAGIVRPATARAIQMVTRVPRDARFLQAVENTPGARLTDDGLELELLRYQKPEQAGAQAIREGVFYLPATLPSRSVGSYKQSTHDPRQMLYGGSERVRGETLLRAPLAVRGTTGGNVPRTAYLELGGNEEMLRVGPEIEATFRRSAPWGGNRIPTPASYRAVEDWLDARGGNPYVATELVNNSLRGDQLFWALRENIIGNRARREGYDSIVGTGARKPRFTEVFDLREAAYPVPGAPQFEMLLPQFEDALR
jgi:hypothetical protein